MNEIAKQRNRIAKELVSELNESGLSPTVSTIINNRIKYQLSFMPHLHCICLFLLKYIYTNQ